MNKYLFLFICLLFVIPFINASYSVNNYSISDSYARGGYLSGYIDVSFKNQSSDSLFTDSFNNKVSLMELLNNSNYLYSCYPESCLKYYKEINPSTTKSISLGENESVLFGFRLKGIVEEINSIQFNFSSNAGQSQNNQIKIDILNDGSYEAGNTKTGQVSSLQNFGCYNSAQVFDEISVDSTAYCQQVNLTEAPAFLIGAEIKRKTAGTQTIRMTLYNSDGQELSECILPNETITSSFSKVSCQVNYLVAEPSEYFICISSNGGNGEYKIPAYSSNDEDENCGFRGEPPGEFSGSYKLFATPFLFGSVGSVKINETLPDGSSFVELVTNYIGDTYNFNCTNGCLIPIKAVSSVPQTLNLNDALVSYDTNLGSNSETNSIYDIQIISPLINSTSQKLYLDNHFKLPSEAKNYTYVLKFDNNNIISKKILISNTSIKLSPLRTAQGFPTNFTISGFLGKEYSWDFGDGNITTSTINSVIHKYSSIGNYTISVNVLGANGEKISDTFLVYSESPERLITSEIALQTSNLARVKSQIASYDSFSKQVIENVLNLTSLELKLKSIEMAFNSSNPDYDSIMSELFSGDFPTAILKSSTKGIPFYVQGSTIDMASLAEASGSSLSGSNENDLRDSLLYWDSQNIDVEVTMDNYLVKKNAELLSTVTIYTLDFTPASEFFGNYYVIFDSENLIVNNNLINLSNGKKTIELNGPSSISFYTSESVSNLPVFYGPAFSELNITESNFIEAEKSKKKAMYTWISIFGVIIFGFLLYFFLHRWYKIKYEKYLFKDRNNLYNVMVYVNGVKKQGMPNEEIKESLKKSGWNAEQIRYIMRKFEGRNTGLPSFRKTNLANQQVAEKNPISISTKNLQNKDNQGHKL